MCQDTLGLIKTALKIMQNFDWMKYSLFNDKRENIFSLN